MSEIIYERKYPRKTEEEERQKVEAWERSHPEEQGESPWPTFEAFCRDILGKQTLVLLADRAPLAQRFIDLAIEAGELYELDTTITRQDSHISVEYRFDDTGSMDLLTPLLRMTDSISISPRKESPAISLNLDYYTHAVYRGKHLVQPVGLMNKNR